MLLGLRPTALPRVSSPRRKSGRKRGLNAGGLNPTFRAQSTPHSTPSRILLHLTLRHLFLTRCRIYRTGVFMSSIVPDKPALEGLEDKWAPVWENEGTYRFDRRKALADGSDSVFSVDTPPPTASGSLHIGHVFSYTHMDLVTRFQRMRGKDIFYPMGWDDNGLPTERRVQNYYGVRCDPTLPY